jgi:hypothetical protein
MRHGVLIVGTSGRVVIHKGIYRYVLKSCYGYTLPLVSCTYFYDCLSFFDGDVTHLVTPFTVDTSFFSLLILPVLYSHVSAPAGASSSYTASSTLILMYALRAITLPFTYYVTYRSLSLYSPK